MAEDMSTLRRIEELALLLYSKQMQHVNTHFYAAGRCLGRITVKRSLRGFNQKQKDRRRRLPQFGTILIAGVEPDHGSNGTRWSHASYDRLQHRRAAYEALRGQRRLSQGQLLACLNLKRLQNDATAAA
jgi:hypothetical protein